MAITFESRGYGYKAVVEIPYNMFLARASDTVVARSKDSTDNYIRRKVMDGSLDRFHDP